LDSAKILVVTGNLNRDILVKMLEEARAIVDCLQVYKTEPVDLAGDPAAAEFRRLGADAVLFASSSSAQSFVDQGAALELAKGAKRPLNGSMGPQTSETMRKAGLRVDFEAPGPGIDELVGALVRALS
jgi:uroporphyrinogen-III synthase